MEIIILQTVASFEGTNSRDFIAQESNNCYALCIYSVQLFG